MFIGLTGGIATGKSVVSGYFEAIGVPVVDADIIAHGLTRPLEEGYRKVIEAFGGGILAFDGTIDRKLLGGIVFQDRGKLALLNSILHPLVLEEIDKEKERYKSYPVVIFSIPLLIEIDIMKQFDKIILAYADYDTQLMRLIKRENLREEDARRRISSQISIEEKRKYADFIIDTRTDFSNIENHVKNIYNFLLDLHKKAQSN